MLGNNIRQMSDAELSAAIKTLIEDREPESLRLDYKETLDISKDSGKKELAKDVSSFANEQGGVLIYGVPEARDGELPKPKPLSECGMEIDRSLPESIERILISTVQPPLHALTIRVVGLPEIAPKQLLTIQHPESYWKPHMIEGYGVGRYYRRGNFQAVIMNEREVEAAYLAREAARTHALEFFDTALFGPAYGIQIRAVACPVMPGRFKDRMLESGFRDWLDVNPPMGPDHARSGAWLPFLDGWRFLGHPEGSISGKQYEIRIFHNGAVCMNMDPCASSTDGRIEPCIDADTLLLDKVERKLRHLFVQYSATVFGELGIDGPLVVRFWLLKAQGLRGAPDTQKHTEVKNLRSCTAEHGSAIIDRCVISKTPDEPGQPYLDGEDMAFDEETSTDEMAKRPEAFVSRLITRISTAFGLWGTEEDEA